MPFTTTKALFVLLPFFLAQVSAHGYITSPTARQPGNSFGQICGSQALSNQASDIYGNVQGELQVATPSADCNLWLCKGFLFADQDAANIQAYTAGQVVPITFEIRAPHDGTANISIVDIASNSVISELRSWEKYALTSVPLSAEEQDFSVTIPSDLGGKCTTAGECVIQMFWDARSVDQTYESCIDFTVGGGSAGNAPASSVSSAAPVASTSVSAAMSSVASSGSVVLTTSASTEVKAISSTTEAASAVTSAPGTSAAAETFTMTAGTMTMACHEEL